MRIGLARIGLVVSVLAGMFALTPAAHAATITVNTTTDELNTDGDCSLREAIRSANSDGVDPHDACASGSGADTITLPAGIYSLSVGPAGDDDAMAGDLDITSDVTIDPTGVVTIDGGNLDRVFHVLGSANLSIAELTIRGGSASTFGGAIYNTATLTLTGSTLTDNQATLAGGAISNTGTATLTNVTLSGNRTLAGGGGLSNSGASSLNNVTIANNTADDDADGTGDGGGIFFDAGTVTLSNTIVGDNTDKSTGADPKYPDCSGTLTSGGYNLIGDTAGCTIVGDTTGNVLGQKPQLEALGDNGGPTQTHALKKNSPAINAGNPAAPGSGGGACEATDQRGVPRPGGPRCDIGAFEVAKGLQCRGKEATIVGTSGPDTITGTNKGDVVLALGGDDTIATGGGKDTVCAGDGNDRANGEQGGDALVGQGGNDKARGGGGGDLIKGNKGNDRLKGQARDDTLRGGTGNDGLNGGKGFDVCKGGPGKDRIRRCERRA